jgi:DNA-binding NarL/FixJ family response regulator
MKRTRTTYEQITAIREMHQKGISNYKIAKSLSISPNTVSYHIRAMTPTKQLSNDIDNQIFEQEQKLIKLLIQRSKEQLSIPSYN